MCLYGQHGDLTTSFHPTTETASMYVGGGGGCASCDYLFTIPLITLDFQEETAMKHLLMDALWFLFIYCCCYLVFGKV
jgi:hypothetical protein